jgi:hypothetical protein
MDTTKRQTFFINDYNRIFTVRLAWNIGQPFVCGSLKDVVEYALKPNNGIEYFAEITNHSFKKVSKKDLKIMLEAQGLNELSKELFSKF